MGDPPSDEFVGADETAEPRAKVPISFILLVGAAAIYVILRLIQMGGWLIDWLAG